MSGTTWATFHRLADRALTAWFLYIMAAVWAHHFAGPAYMFRAK